MSSLALYRRYRPETFAEVIGQEHVTDPLQQALRNNRVNHAYLFSGPRGCGKTTSARILARCLNCEQGPTPTPCGVCRSCQDLARNGPGSIDVIEIDAASHGGVDDARELREKAFFGPASSRYKIYIVDEAHMVTPAGFNALLKVVEEPPEHLKFIFATTEPEKVIGTIRSRTHHYPFRLVPPGTLRDYLADVCGRESIPVDDAVLPLAVRAGAGSVRDAMSVMDQLLAGAGDEGVTYAMATALLGYTDGALLDSVVDAFASGDGAAAFGIVDRVIEGGHDPRRFVADLLERLRDLVILAAVPGAAEKGLIDAPPDVVERMAAQAQRFGAAELSRAADLVNTGLTEMRGATSPRLQLELICARVLLPATYSDERSVQARLDRLERGVGSGAGPGGASAGAVPGGVAPGGETPGGAAANAPAGPAAARAAMGGGRQGGEEASRPGPPAGGGQERPAAPEPAAAPEPGDGVGPDGWPAGARAAAAPAAGSGGGPQEAARQPGAWPTGTGTGTASAPAPESGSAAPGAAPGGQSTGQRGERTPGAWPTVAGPGGQAGPSGRTGPGGTATPGTSQGGPPAGGPGAGGPAPSAPSGPGASGPAAGGGPGAQPVQDSTHGPAQVRELWPQILEAVKNRRRFTWILLSQNAQVAGFDGTTLQVGFTTTGARDSFVGGGSADVLVQALQDAIGVQWKVEAIVDPSGGAGQGPSGASGGGAPGGPGGSGPGAGGPVAGGGGGAAPPPGGGGAPRSPAPAGSGDGSTGVASGPGAAAGARTALARAQDPAASGEAAPRGQVAEAAPPASVERAPFEDDVPADDDADLDETALSGYDLIVRELGATVLEEIQHD
ncbi:DNA polymerase III subunit gamma and tau [Streptomyces sp. TR06-5]|uniref:DNA polymerase III subunit gamma and tau n=1 Tax=Streptomyces sp. TR06-5 TaxID=3385976 RepID=UPI0039A1E8EB